MSSPLPSYEEAAARVARYAARCVAQCIEDLRRSQPSLERVALTDAAGRVLAHPLHADSDQPAFPRSTRDGFACRASEASKHKPLPIAGFTRAGEPPPGPLPAGVAWEIMTGAVVPEGADAVMMIEHVETGGAAGRTVRLLPPRTLAPGENIVARGAQAHAGDELLPAGAALGFAQIALAASCGHAELDVFARPRVAILSTGDELVPTERQPALGQVRNSSAPMLAAMAASAGGEPWVLPIAADTAEALDAALEQAREADLLLITGGVSAGKFDLVEPALARAGARFHFTGVRIQPGKPLVFGELPGTHTAAVQRKKGWRPFFGLPGNPVSSAVTFLLFGAPVVAALAGRIGAGPRFALARLVTEPAKYARSGAKQARSGLTRFLPAVCDFAATVSRLPQVALAAWEGSGDLAGLARANCFLVLPEEDSDEGRNRLEAGDLVRILLI